MKLKRTVGAIAFLVVLGGVLTAGIGNAATTTAAPTPAPTTTIDASPTAVAAPPTTRVAPDGRPTTADPAQIAAQRQAQARAQAAAGSREIPVRPNGAPETGGGAMAAVVSTWG
ncbi:MAG TPA: hypothetical protein VHW44_30795 [Pseudonocardiaceae bacterium]|nr:hypothetical protein [Pseudonocardiaceae bacterium]